MQLILFALLLCICLVQATTDNYFKEFRKVCFELSRDPVKGFRRDMCTAHKWLVPPELLDEIHSKMNPELKVIHDKLEEENSWKNNKVRSLFQTVSTFIVVHLFLR
jgi:hypothetical protein